MLASLSSLDKELISQQEIGSQLSNKAQPQVASKMVNFTMAFWKQLSISDTNF